MYLCYFLHNGIDILSVVGNHAAAVREYEHQADTGAGYYGAQVFLITCVILLRVVQFFD